MAAEAYATLGLKTEASVDEVKAAYRQLGNGIPTSTANAHVI